MSDFIAKFQQDFIESDRYLYLLRGLGNTLLIAALAVILGIVLGFLVAIIRFSFCVETTEEEIDYAVKEMAALVPMLQKYTRH